MLRNLHIKNLALIREVDVDFTEGLNILTGETGAGKSIIVDAIGLALGGRVQRDLAGGAGGPSLLELVFEVQEEAVLAALTERGIEAEDGVVLISRKMLDGRSQFRINGEAQPSGKVREIAALLIDIHGQSEHQKLLRPEVQLALLDTFGGEEIAALKEQVAADYKVWSGIKKALGGAELSEEERERRMAFLRLEIGEIDAAALHEGEDEEVEKRYRKLINAKKIAEAAFEVHEATGYNDP